MFRKFFETMLSSSPGRARMFLLFIAFKKEDWTGRKYVPDRYQNN